MRVLLFGANGQVGRETLARQSAEIDFHVPDRAAVDLARPDTIRRTILEAEGIDCILNAAAYTAVDKAESEKDLAFAVNATAPGEMARAAAERGVPLLHISTDYVFDGTKHGPYREDDPTGPRSVYGASKLAGEDAVREALDEHIILRTAWVFSAYGKNFARTVLRLAREKGHLRIVDDQRGAPTPAGDIAAALLAIAARIADGRLVHAGTYHFAGDEACSWADFAQAIVAASPLGAVPLERIPTSAFPTPAVRPMNSVLDCARIGEHYAIAPAPWRRRLGDIVPALIDSPA